MVETTNLKVVKSCLSVKIEWNIWIYLIEIPIYMEIMEIYLEIPSLEESI